MVERIRLSNRHVSVTTNILWITGSGAEQRLVVTYGVDENGRTVREAFCGAFKRDSDMVALANDACILLSRLLQMGVTLTEIMRSLGENRQEGAAFGPPSSIIGAIVHGGLAIESGLPTDEGPM